MKLKPQSEPCDPARCWSRNKQPVAATFPVCQFLSTYSGEVDPKRKTPTVACVCRVYVIFPSTAFFLPISIFSVQLREEQTYYNSD